MQKRKWKAQLWWVFQLSLLCLMVSTPLWINRDFGFHLPDLENAARELELPSSLQSTQVVEVDFDARNDSDSLMTVNAKQLRFQSKAVLAKKSLPTGASLKSSAPKRSTAKQGEASGVRWWLKGIERNSPARADSLRAPASAVASNAEEIKILSFDDDVYFSEYFELSEGLNEFQIHFTNDEQKIKTRRYKIVFNSQ